MASRAVLPAARIGSICCRSPSASVHPRSNRTYSLLGRGVSRRDGTVVHAEHAGVAVSTAQGQPDGAGRRGAPAGRNRQTSTLRPDELCSGLRANETRLIPGRPYTRRLRAGHEPRKLWPPSAHAAAVIGRNGARPRREARTSERRRARSLASSRSRDLSFTLTHIMVLLRICDPDIMLRVRSNTRL